MTEQHPTLDQTHLYEGLSKSYDGVDIVELVIGEIVSISAQENHHRHINSTFRASYGVDLPDVGSVAAIEDGMVFWVGPGQWFLSQSLENMFLDQELGALFGNSAAVTLQSDAWLGLEVSGSRARSVFERLIPLDLSSDEFAAGSVARTLMEHLNVFVMRPDTNTQRFIVFGARSFASSLLEEIERAAITVCE